MTGPLLPTAVALLTGAAVAGGLLAVRRPRRRLAGRVRPYAAPALAALGRPVAELPLDGPTGRPTTASPLGVLRRLLLRAPVDDPVLLSRLRQSGRYAVDDHLLVAEHRARCTLAGLAGAAVALVAGVAGDVRPAAGLALAGIGAVAGAARPRAAVDRAIAARREALRAEVPALCHLLALRLRAGGSVVTALTGTAARCRGELVAELLEALAQHRAGRPLAEALDAAARATASPDAARVHRLLAAAIRHGLDAAPELLRLAREVRQAHLVDLRRAATGRRAAVLLPTIGLLAPLILLFLAAPLPGLLGGL